MTFKASGHTTLQGPMTEVNATRSPGAYRRDLDPTDITNLDAGDIFQVEISDTAGVAKNMPQSGEIKVGVSVT